MRVAAAPEPSANELANTIVRPSWILHPASSPAAEQWLVLTVPNDTRLILLVQDVYKRQPFDGFFESSWN